MEAITRLLAPKSIAVVGASQRRGRGTNVIAHLQNHGFKGEIFAVNPRYDEVLGCKCYPAVADLPASVECVVLATSADTACDVLEQAYAHGIRAAIVLSSGFGEGGHDAGKERARRVRALAEQGMCICGPNCMGIVNTKASTAAFSSGLPATLRGGSVALVSQSGGLGSTAFTPLMTDRELGFAYFVSCGNQLGATVEDFIEAFVDDPDVSVIAVVIEALKNPRKLQQVARAALTKGKSIVLVPVRAVRRRADHDPVAHRRARQRQRRSGGFSQTLWHRAGRNLRSIRRDHRAVCPCSAGCRCWRRGRRRVRERRRGRKRSRLAHPCGNASGCARRRRRESNSEPFFPSSAA